MAKKSITSPKGTASYPWLTKPDTKFSAEGVYKTGLTVKGKDAQAFQEDIKAAFIDEFGQSKLAKAHLPWKEEEDGSVTFNFKSKMKPRLFDSKGQAITNDPAVSGGSVIKVSCAFGPYNKGANMGVALYLNAVQIIELVEYSSSPFGEEEGGYVASNDNGAEEVPFETDDNEAEF